MVISLSKLQLEEGIPLGYWKKKKSAQTDLMIKNKLCGLIMQYSSDQVSSRLSIMVVESNKNVFETKLFFLRIMTVDKLIVLRE